MTGRYNEHERARNLRIDSSHTTVAFPAPQRLRRAWWLFNLIELTLDTIDETFGTLDEADYLHDPRYCVAQPCY
jgi:hypothetical protein